MKRKLKLLNEVLPAPEAATGALSPRARVLRHVTALMSSAAAVATAASCGYGVVDPLPNPVTPPTLDGGDDARDDVIVAHPTVDGGHDAAVDGAVDASADGSDAADAASIDDAGDAGDDQ